jgi:DnaJ-class molecular chaperone
MHQLMATGRPRAPYICRCPECDGAGFIRKAGATLRANAARKDEAQIVCPNCNGLGKLGQIDK